jgi:hypothetical protein
MNETSGSAPLMVTLSHRARLPKPARWLPDTSRCHSCSADGRQRRPADVAAGGDVLFVYAGASQFAALALISSGASLTTIVLTTFLINARHMLMSVYMAKALRALGLSRMERWAYAGGLTDESFAFHSVKLGTGAPVNIRYLIGFNLFCHTSWVLGGLLGAGARNMRRT